MGCPRIAETEKASLRARRVAGLHQNAFQLTELQELLVNQNHICWRSRLSLVTLKMPQQEGGEAASHCPCLLQTRVLHTCTQNPGRCLAQVERTQGERWCGTEEWVAMMYPAENASIPCAWLSNLL